MNSKHNLYPWLIEYANKSHYYIKKMISQLTEVNESNHDHETDPKTTDERSETEQQPS